MLPTFGGTFDHPPWTLLYLTVIGAPAAIWLGEFSHTIQLSIVASVPSASAWKMAPPFVAVFCASVQLVR